METPVHCRKLIYFIPFCFIIASSAIILLADRGHLPELIHQLYAFPGGDKVGHALLMGGLALLLNLRLRGWGAAILGQRAPLGSTLAAGIAFSEELSQLGFRSCTFSWVDLGFGLLGVTCAGFMVSRIGSGRSVASQLVERNTTLTIDR